MTKKFIQDLVENMTIEEKLAQMTQLSPLFFGIEESVDLTGPMNEMNIESDCIKNIGSTLNVFGAEKLKKMQDEYMKKNRNNIPLLFMADVIHGYKTIFPIPLALGCSFNPKNYEITASISAKECSASGIHLTFSPMSDLVRDPRWGRVMESTGEDTYLNSVMTAAAVKGFQGNDVKEEGKIASCVKHFAGYGAAEGGRDYNTVSISTGALREYYLPSYKAAIDAGVKMVMTSFNILDGIPSSANNNLLQKILKDEWKFDGTVISDFAAVDETIIHGLAKDGSQAALKCIQAGVDIEMMSSHYINYGKKLVEENKLSIQLIDRAVAKILELKDELGLFENPYKDANPQKEKELHLCKEHRQAAREVARESIVLLKNEDVLPLKNDIKVGIVGPFSLSNNTMGGWAVANKKDSVSLYDGIIEKISKQDVITAMDSGIGAMQEGIFDIVDEIEDTVRKLKDCDVIITAVGENPADTGEAASKTNLHLSYNQEKMIAELSKLGKLIIAVIFSGRPMEIKPILPYCNAVVQAWFLGTESGNAIADVLFGDYNPSARLSMSFPQTVGQIPVYYNCYNTGRPALNKKERYISRYLDCPNRPLFCFGYGLSYSIFEYSDYKVWIDNDVVKASISIYNNSDRLGKETVQLYIRDCYASVVRPIKELKSFKQVILNPYEKRVVEFTITKDMLKFWNHNYEYVFEAGEFDIMVGRNSEDLFIKRINIE